LQLLLPDESYIYLGDTARTPYGPKSAETIRAYSKECAKFLGGRGVKLLVVACNTSSSYALDLLASELSCPVIGTIMPAAIKAASVTRSGRVGVIGTEATILSDAYSRALKGLAPEVHTYSKDCPLFVPVVEQGLTSGPVVEELVKLYLAPLMNLNVDSLILGCTHYPLLTEAIESYAGEAVTIVNCASCVAEKAKEMLMEREMAVAKNDSKRDIYYVTDAASIFKYLASLFLGSAVVEVLELPTLV